MEKGATNIIKIGIVGPESTGKSSLAQALAARYDEPWVPEIARSYVANLNRKYTLNDIVIIAKLQLQQEQALIAKAKKYLFCDTTLLVNKIWASFVFNEVPMAIQKLYHANDYHLHLLCDIDLPWEFDPLREHPNDRKELLALYEHDLKKTKANYYMISGVEQERVQSAVEVIKKCFD
jgi:nicotinamide riboside kinase